MHLALIATKPARESFITTKMSHDLPRRAKYPSLSKLDSRSGVMDVMDRAANVLREVGEFLLQPCLGDEPRSCQSASFSRP